MIIITAIIALINGTAGLVIAVLVATLSALPNWADVEKDKIYVDVFYVPTYPSNLYMEIDYFYY